MYPYYDFYSKSVIPFCEQLFVVMVDDIRSAFFQNKLTPAKFAFSMQTATNLALKVSDLKNTGSVVLTTDEFAWLERAYEFQTSDLNRLLSSALGNDAYKIQETLQQNYDSFLLLKSNVHVVTTTSTEV